MKKPAYFEDVMSKGDFVSYAHKHHFKQIENGTIMIDEVSFESPRGFLGTLANRLFLTSYMKTLLLKRNETIRAYAESTKWEALLG